jgi:hypothetical protein
MLIHPQRFFLPRVVEQRHTALRPPVRSPLPLPARSPFKTEPASLGFGFVFRGPLAGSAPGDTVDDGRKTQEKTTATNTRRTVRAIHESPGWVCLELRRVYCRKRLLLLRAGKAQAEPVSIMYCPVRR